MKNFQFMVFIISIILPLSPFLSLFSVLSCLLTRLFSVLQYLVFELQRVVEGGGQSNLSLIRPLIEKCERLGVDWRWFFPATLA